jgi:hypothetical protein
MGQFYIIVNLDKGEYIDPADFGYEPKFWGFIYSHIPSVLGFLLAPGWSKYGTWGGDRVLITSDGDEMHSNHECIFLNSIGKTWQDVIDDEPYNLYEIVKKYGTNICDRVKQIYNENELDGPVVAGPWNDNQDDTKYRISQELAQLSSQKLTARNSEVYNIIITYIHKHALFNPNDKSTFIIDDKLASLFNVDSGSTMAYRDVNVYLKSRLNV